METEMPEGLNRGYSNSFLNMLSRIYLPVEPPALTQLELAALDQ